MFTMSPATMLGSTDFLEDKRSNSGMFLFSWRLVPNSIMFPTTDNTDWTSIMCQVLFFDVVIFF